jgi:hypothetical protein
MTMKKVIFSFAFVLLCIFSFGQNVQKGSLLGLHILSPTLKDGVTMEDYVKFYISKAIPAYEKAFPGIKIHLIKSLRGKDSSSLGVLYMFNSEADRNKYFNKEGAFTKLGKAASEKSSYIQKEFDKYAEPSTAPHVYNDWLVK